MAGVVVLWLICVLIAAAIGKSKGEGFSAFIIGLLLGPLGIIIALCSSGNRLPCPFCKEKMNRGATVCPHCHSEISAKPFNKNKFSWIERIALIGFLIPFSIIFYRYLEKSYPNQSYIATADKSTLQTPCKTEFKTLRQWQPGTGIGLEILVDKKTPKTKVLELAACLQVKYQETGFVSIGIYDDINSWENRDNEKFSEKIYFQHYLCQVTVNKNSGYKDIKWLAKNRKEPL